MHHVHEHPKNADQPKARRRDLSSWDTELANAIDPLLKSRLNN